MRNVLNGVLPQTASAGQDPSDAISPKGLLSQDINFASCNGGASPFAPVLYYSSPVLPPPTLAAVQIAHMQNSLTGNGSASVGGKCAGLKHADMIARGFVTVDVVNNCTSRTPSDPGYIGPGGTGDITDQTQLSGEVYYYNPALNTVRGSNAVHIHVGPNGPGAFPPGSYTFYGRFDAFSGADDREPLATTFTARYLSGLFSTIAPVLSERDQRSAPAGPVPGRTRFIVWRDPKVAQGYFTCGSLPSWYPLGQEGITSFDEQEHPTYVSTQFPGSAPFGAATQVVMLGSSALPAPSITGHLFMDLNTPVAGQSAALKDPAADQAWVEVWEQDSTTTQNVQHPAQQLDSANQAAHSYPQP
ncbi:MAG TPA: hypothetical protein VFA04_23060 [Bryobacteraceae bacterium]|nr:hypothetical protein [Bryobacteraceae bacterium]